MARTMRAVDSKPVTSDDRHLRAVERTALWAKEAAEAGNYQDALSWLRVLEVTEGGIPLELVPLRDQCQRVVRHRAALYQNRRAQLDQAMPSATSFTA
jgi:hypothetical protein